jgi:glycosyltransferase involved in cell wall biosynthesis
LTQTHKDIEVIVVDDGSEQELFQELQSNLARLPVQLLQIPHCGIPGKVRNAGIEISRGEWIAFLDSDDYWYPSKIENQLNCALSTQAEVISGNMKNAPIHSPNSNKHMEGGIKLGNLLDANLICNSSVLVSKTALESVGNVVETKNCVGVEDYATWLRLVLNFKWVHIYETVGFYESASVDSISKLEVKNKFNRYFALIDFVNWVDENHRSNLYVSRSILKCLKYSLISELR